MARKPVRRPYERVERIVGNQSSRYPGGSPTLIVLHSTESHDRPGNADLESIGAWFDNPQSGASSHVCVDGEGRSAQFVRDMRKAWTCAAYNSVSLNIEQIGFARWPTYVWNRNSRAQLKKVAKYIAFWSKQYNIPIRRARVAGGDVVRAGVITHAELGQAGGGHHDPGAGYPFAAVLKMAQYYKRYGWK